MGRVPASSYCSCRRNIAMVARQRFDLPFPSLRRRGTDRTSRCLKHDFEIGSSPAPLARSKNGHALEFLHDPFGVAGQLHIASSMNRLPLCCAGCLDSTFPIGDLSAAFGGELLVCHERNEVQR